LNVRFSLQTEEEAAMLKLAGNTGTAAGRRYVWRTTGFMAGYVGVMVGVIFGAWDDIQGTPAAWILAAAVTAPVIGQLWATLAFMREADEYVRSLIAKLFILSSGLAIAVATLWGFGESFAGAPHVPSWMIYPLFWAIFGLVGPFVRSTR
jgi:putative oxidoreductase